MQKPMVQTYLIKPAIVGGIGALASSYVLGADAPMLEIPLVGMPVSASTLVGVSVAGASVASSALHDVVLERVAPDKTAADMEARIIGPALTAAASVGAFWLTIGQPNVTAALQVAAIGAGAEIAGSYIGDTIALPMAQKSAITG